MGGDRGVEGWGVGGVFGGWSGGVKGGVRGVGR